MARRRKLDPEVPEVEVIPPGVAIIINADYLRQQARITRAIVVRTLLEDVLDQLVWAARSGQLEALVEIPTSKLDPRSVAEALADALKLRGINARPAEALVQSRFGEEKKLVVQATWREVYHG